MKILSIFNTKMKPLAAIITVVLLILVAVFHYVFFNHSRDMLSRQAEILDQTFTASQWADIDEVINLTTITARMSAVDVAGDIVRDLKTEYPNMEELHKSLHDGKYPDKFNSIILSNIKDHYIYDIHNHRNDIFVISRNEVVFDSNIRTLESTHRSFKDEESFHYNISLMYNALNNLIEHKDSSLIYYEPITPDSPDEHKIIEYPEKSELKEVYLKEGLQGLKGYVILVPAYITDDGDIFGIPDIAPDGTLNRNHKLIVVQRFSIYDVMEQLEHQRTIKEGSHKLMHMSIDEILEFCTVSYVCIAILDLIALLLLIFYATNKVDGIRKDNES